MDHECTQKQSILNLMRATARLNHIIEGDGTPGLYTRVALLDQRIQTLLSSMPTANSLKLYAFLGGGAAFFIFFLFKFLLEGVTG